jgi:hypothetical protein
VTAIAKRCCQCVGPLLDALEPEMLRRDRRRIEAAAVVSDLQENAAVWLPCEADGCPAGAGMASDVGERFLSDPKEGGFPIGRQPLFCQRGRKLNVGNLQSGIGHQRLNRRHETEFVQGRRPQASDQVPGLGGGFPQQSKDLIDVAVAAHATRQPHLVGFKVHDGG